MGDTYGDVVYEVWRSGGNPDYVERDDVRDYEREGYYAEEIADMFLRRQERAHDRMVQGILPDDDEVQS